MLRTSDQKMLHIVAQCNKAKPIKKTRHKVEKKKSNGIAMVYDSRNGMFYDKFEEAKRIEKIKSNFANTIKLNVSPKKRPRKTSILASLEEPSKSEFSEFQNRLLSSEIKGIYRRFIIEHLLGFLCRVISQKNIFF